ncbi:MAG TPA: hypothetical protein VEA80_18080 [Vitreimonas sp.]|uniref:hypothetical protein n=1 Tax=Vitreimonas sp. TaxID=3069702 RepID=UPI002D5C6A1D|nr:hypothetical protein [Vitreimonas sp.]HYD89393.1 hypothetical protein [Vitreimonas sp.]
MTAATATKTPWHLWLVGVLALLWNGFGAFDFTATCMRFEPWISQFSPAMRDYIYALPAWNWVGWAIGTWGGFIGSALLLMRNKLAVWAYAASLLGAVGSNALTLFDPPPAEVGASSVLTIVIIVIAALLLAYAWWLSRRGVLR